MTCVVHYLPMLHIYTICHSATDMDMMWRIQSVSVELWNHWRYELETNHKLFDIQIIKNLCQ